MLKDLRLWADGRFSHRLLQGTGERKMGVDERENWENKMSIEGRMMEVAVAPTGSMAYIRV